MEVRIKTISFSYRYFAPGELVRCVIDSECFNLRKNFVYCVVKFFEPDHSGHASFIAVEENGPRIPDWYFEPVNM